ncbi:MAG: hypothetical protein KF861_14295 [Planctomycetaceae bacterium]|nr:hypothetical protein [Planctomycetaceae bacterium]
MACPLFQRPENVANQCTTTTTIGEVSGIVQVAAERSVIGGTAKIRDASSESQWWETGHATVVGTETASVGVAKVRRTWTAESVAESTSADQEAGGCYISSLNWKASDDEADSPDVAGTSHTLSGATTISDRAAPTPPERRAVEPQTIASRAVEITSTVTIVESPPVSSHPLEQSAERPIEEPIAAGPQFMPTETVVHRNLQAAPSVSPPSAVPPIVVPQTIDSNGGSQRAQTIAGYLEQLQKPMMAITTGAALHSNQDPPNLAAELQHGIPPIYEWGQPWVVPRPNRYPYVFRHNPLYFEEPNLERCGRAHGCLQPVYSSAAFAGRAVLLPMMMMYQDPCLLVPSPGDCRTCEQYECQDVVPQATPAGVAVEAAVITGLVFLLL